MPKQLPKYVKLQDINLAIELAYGFLSARYGWKFNNVLLMFQWNVTGSRYFRNRHKPDLPPTACIHIDPRVALYAMKTLGKYHQVTNTGYLPAIATAIVHELTHHVQHEEDRSRGELETTRNELDFLRLNFPEWYSRIMIQPKNTTMDLISAKVEAAKLSRTKKQKMYINVDGEGECTVSEKPKGAITAYNNGSEVALESSIEIPTTQPIIKKQKVMSDVKAPVKKATAKKEVKKVAVKTERPSNLIGKATTVFLTQAQWNKFAEKGNIRDNVSKAVIKTFGL